MGGRNSRHPAENYRELRNKKKKKERIWFKQSLLLILTEPNISPDRSNHGRRRRRIREEEKGEGQGEEHEEGMTGTGGGALGGGGGRG